MNVYVNKVTAPCGGGLSIVAANSIQEAHSTLLSRYKKEDIANHWYNDYYAEIYKSDTWKQLSGVSVDSDIPYVIEEGSYVE